MSVTPFQPTLPDEVSFTEAELSYIEDSPPGLYPENQNSNYGLLRKANTDQIQKLIDQLALMYNERFVRTSLQFLDVWEEEVGLPVAPQGKTTDQRRVAILGRISKGPFTRERRESVVRGFIVATFGGPIQLFPDGYALSAAGGPLYGEFADPDTLFSIRENGPVGVNLLPNGNFENDMDGWTFQDTTGALVTSQAKWGTHALQVTAIAASPAIYGHLTISGATLGQTYVGSMWVKGTGPTIGKLFVFNVLEVGGAQSYQGGPAVTTTLTSEWQRVIAYITLQQNDRTEVQIVGYTSGGAINDVWFADGAQLELKSSSDMPASPFVDPEQTPYYYEVQIKNTVTPDMVGLIRELNRITPAGITFDVLSVAQIDPVRNYVTNPTLDHDTAYWTFVALSGSSGNLTSGTFGIAGDNVGRIYANPGSGPNLGAQTKLYDLIGGRKYRFSAWVYNEPGMVMWVHFSSSQRDANMANSAPTSNVWQQIVFDFTTLPGETQITLQFVVGANYQNKSFYFDDVFVTEA